MTLSNHEKIEITRKVFRAQEGLGESAYSYLLSYQMGLSDAIDFVDGDAALRLAEMAKVVRSVIQEMEERQHAAWLEATRRALADSHTRKQQLACLREFSWCLDDAIDEGLIEEEDA